MKPRRVRRVIATLEVETNASLDDLGRAENWCFFIDNVAPPAKIVQVQINVVKPERKKRAKRA